MHLKQQSSAGNLRSRAQEGIEHSMGSVLFPAFPVLALSGPGSRFGLGAWAGLTGFIKTVARSSSVSYGSPARSKVRCQHVQSKYGSEEHKKANE